MGTITCVGAGGIYRDVRPGYTAESAARERERARVHLEEFTLEQVQAALKQRAEIRSRPPAIGNRRNKARRACNRRSSMLFSWQLDIPPRKQVDSLEVSFQPVEGSGLVPAVVDISFRVVKYLDERGGGRERTRAVRWDSPYFTCTGPALHCSRRRRVPALLEPERRRVEVKGGPGTDPQLGLLLAYVCTLLGGDPFVLTCLSDPDYPLPGPRGRAKGKGGRSMDRYAARWPDKVLPVPAHGAAAAPAELATTAVHLLRLTSDVDQDPGVRGEALATDSNHHSGACVTSRTDSRDGEHGTDLADAEARAPPHCQSVFPAAFIDPPVHRFTVQEVEVEGICDTLAPPELGGRLSLEEGMDLDWLGASVLFRGLVNPCHDEEIVNNDL